MAKSFIYVVRQMQVSSEIQKARAMNVSEKLKNVPFIIGITSGESVAEETAKIILQYRKWVSLCTTPLLRDKYHDVIEESLTNYSIPSNDLQTRTFLEHVDPLIEDYLL